MREVFPDGAGNTCRKMATVRKLGQPCRSRNVLAGRVLSFQNRTYFVLTNMNESLGMELILIDTSSGKGEVYRAPAGAGSWALNLLPENRLLVGTYYDGMAMVFDLPSRQWVHHSRLSSEEYIWTWAEGGDGRFYGGTYPGGKLGAFDPKTLRWEDLGAPTKADGNLYLRNTSALPDGRILCQFGFTKAQTLLYDPRTKQFTPTPPSWEGAAIGVAWNGYFLAGSRAFRLPDLTPVEPLPFPAPPAEKGGWSVETRLTDSDELILRQGDQFWRYKTGDKALTPLGGVPTSSATLYGKDSRGALYFVRGQDYAIVTPRSRTLDLKPIPGETAPRDLHFIRADDRGRVWGGPPFGQTLCYLDTATGKTVNTRTVSNAGGEVYDAAIVDGICYAAAYAGGEIIRFDPSAAWNQLDGINPKTIATVAPDFIRPTGGIHRGSDGKLYSGWQAKYGTYGGALAVTDPATGKHERFDNPLGAFAIFGVAPLGDGRVLLSAGLGANGLPDQTGTGTIGLFDTRTKTVIWSQALRGTKAANATVYDPATKRGAFLAAGKLYVVDPEHPDLSFPAAVEKATAGQLALAGSRVLYCVERQLWALDLATGKTVLLAELPEKIVKLAAGPRGKHYVASGATLYEVSE